MTTRKTDAELKPCPFCNGKVDLIYQGSSDWSIECEGCCIAASFWVDAHKYGYGEGETLEVIKRWNMRTHELALLEGLKLAQKVMNQIEGGCSFPEDEVQKAILTVIRPALNSISALLSTEAQQ